MYNKNYKQILSYLQKGATVITPNNRLAKTIINDYLLYSNQYVSSKPNCFSYQFFLQKLYKDVEHTMTNIAHPTLLTKQQSWYLWRKILIKEDGTTYYGLINEISKS